VASEFQRDELLAAFDEIGSAAVAARTRLDIAVFGGSALLLASNFRYATEDVDVAEIVQPWPEWLTTSIAAIAKRNGWAEDWFNDAVSFHLSVQANAERDLIRWGTFPRNLEQVGLTVFVPSAEYMLALKLKAARVSDFAKGRQDLTDLANLLRVLGIQDVEPAIAILAKYFPTSAAHADKERFVIKYLLNQEGPAGAPSYPRGND
jgi:hypothetical protein